MISGVGFVCFLLVYVGKRKKTIYKNGIFFTFSVGGWRDTWQEKARKICVNYYQVQVLVFVHIIILYCIGFALTRPYSSLRCILPAGL